MTHIRRLSRNNLHEREREGQLSFSFRATKGLETYLILNERHSPTQTRPDQLQLPRQILRSQNGVVVLLDVGLRTFLLCDDEILEGGGDGWKGVGEEC